MNRSEILTTANDLITGTRAATYGDAHKGFAAIAKAWDALDAARGDRERSGADVALFMDAMKSIRAATNPGHEDNWVDKCGFSAIGGEIAGQK